VRAAVEGCVAKCRAKVAQLEVEKTALQADWERAARYLNEAPHDVAAFIKAAQDLLDFANEFDLARRSFEQKLQRRQMEQLRQQHHQQRQKEV
jgi:hypothetical protein